MHTIHTTHANTVHTSHQGLSGTSVGPHTSFLSQSQDSTTVGRWGRRSAAPGVPPPRHPFHPHDRASVSLYAAQGHIYIYTHAPYYMNWDVEPPPRSTLNIYNHTRAHGKAAGSDPHLAHSVELSRSRVEYSPGRPPTPCQKTCVICGRLKCDSKRTLLSPVVERSLFGMQGDDQLKVGNKVHLIVVSMHLNGTPAHHASAVLRTHAHWEEEQQHGVLGRDHAF